MVAADRLNAPWIQPLGVLKLSSRSPEDLGHTRFIAAVLTVRALASETLTEDAHWRLLKFRHKAVLGPDGCKRHTHGSPDEALAGLPGHGLVLEFDKVRTDQEDFVLDAMALRGHVLHLVPIGEVGRRTGLNRT